jgi:hypothetical protein
VKFTAMLSISVPVLAGLAVKFRSERLWLPTEKWDGLKP